MNTLFLDEEDINFLVDSIDKLQIVFHPSIAPKGHINYRYFNEIKQKKELALIIDRNLLVSLLKFSQNGELKNKGEAQIVGLLLTWANMNNIPISAGFAVWERASQLGSQDEALQELQRFFEIINGYPLQMWLQVAEGQQSTIPKYDFSNNPLVDITYDYSDAGDHFDMAYAALLHAVLLYRDGQKSPVTKFIDFYNWMCDKMLIGEYLLVYIAMWFTEQENIKAPKNAKSNNLELIISGCKNQAWDIAHLTNWSTIYSHSDNYPAEVLFATNDMLLKRIFVNKHGPGGLNGLLFSCFNQKEYNTIIDCMEARQNNRVKPDFGNDSHCYFQTLIDSEIEKIKSSLK